MMPRRNSVAVMVGGVQVGGGASVVVQSMTNTDTADVQATITQVMELYAAGSQIVRLTVNNDAAAKAVPHVRDGLLVMGVNVPLVGDFHYNGHRLLETYPEAAAALAKYRINPGNVGFGAKHDAQFSRIIEVALKHNKPVRIGVNWGSLDAQLLARLMDENAKLPSPQTAQSVQEEALIVSSLESAAMAETLGMASNQIILSAKVSEVQPLIRVYRSLAVRCSYALHLGLTEAGIGSKGIVASTAALAILLQEGIGDTIRISITPLPNAPRTEEVVVAQELLQVMGIRSFTPLVTACPGCGRTTSTYFQALANDIQTWLREQMPEWREKYIGVEEMKVAVMGCIVNGPGESKHANIGISLPGTGESPIAPVFEDGLRVAILRGENIAFEFKARVEAYIARTYF